MTNKDLISKIQELDLKLSRLEKSHQKTDDSIHIELIEKKISAMIKAQKPEKVSDSHILAIVNNEIAKIPKFEKVSDSHILAIVNNAIEKTSINDSYIFGLIKKHVNVNFINKLYRNK